MRIVEYEKDQGQPLYRITRGIGIAAGIFSLVVCVLMIANNTRLKSADPIHSPALEKLMAELHENPDDIALREQIRELDHLARAAFFTSQRFTQVGIYLLLTGLAVMVIAFKVVGNFNARPPYPDSDDPKDDLVKEARWARWAVGIAGLIIVGFALALAIPWRSPLNDAAPAPPPTGAATATATTTTETKAAPAAPEKPAAPETPAPAAPEMAPVTRADLLANWGSFRGAGNGVVHGKDLAALPTAWDGATGEGILWKTAIPKPGFSSPIVWGERIFLSGGDEETLEIYCVNTADGKILWQKEISGVPGSPADPPEVSADTGYAAATMATNGTLVFAIFSNGDIVALDFDGNRIWARNLGAPVNNYGHASSLTVFEDTVLVQFDHDAEGGGKFFALEVGTGKTRWEVAREFPASWSSPLVVDTGERTEVILATDPAVISYDPATGDELWRVDCLKNGEVAPTPVFADGMLFVAADYVNITAIDMATREVAWQVETDVPGVSTPLVHGGFLIYGLGDGGIVCRDARTGEEVWYELTDDGSYASPILAGDRVYLIDRAGNTAIFPPAAEFKPVSTPALGEEVVSTPAVIGKSLYIRGVTHLYRIGS